MHLHGDVEITVLFSMPPVSDNILISKEDDQKCHGRLESGRCLFFSSEIPITWNNTASNYFTIL
jgi:hypothetical protein